MPALTAGAYEEKSAASLKGAILMDGECCPIERQMINC
jgi:hypothetical protein